MNDENAMGQVIQIDEARIRDHLGEMVRGTPDLSSLVPSQMPRISRNPSELTAEATSSDTLRDDYGIPESGNGIPDILDEVK